MGKTNLLLEVAFKWDESLQKFVAKDGIETFWSEVIETASKITKIIMNVLDIGISDILDRRIRALGRRNTHARMIFIILLLEKHPALNYNFSFFSNFFRIYDDESMYTYIYKNLTRHKLCMNNYGNKYGFLYHKIKKIFDNSYPSIVDIDVVNKTEIKKIALGDIHASAKYHLPVSHMIFSEILFFVIRKELGVTKEELIAKSRKKEYVEARMIFCFLHRKNYPSISLELVGEKIGGRHHTTVINQIRKHNQLISDSSKKGLLSIKYQEKATLVNLAIPAYLDESKKHGEYLSYNKVIEIIQNIKPSNSRECDTIEQIKKEIINEALSFTWKPRIFLENLLENRGIILNKNTVI